MYLCLIWICDIYFLTVFESVSSSSPFSIIFIYLLKTLAHLSIGFSHILYLVYYNQLILFNTVLYFYSSYKSKKKIRGFIRIRLEFGKSNFFLRTDQEKTLQVGGAWMTLSVESWDPAPRRASC